MAVIKVYSGYGFVERFRIKNSSKILWDVKLHRARTGNGRKGIRGKGYKDIFLGFSGILNFLVRFAFNQSPSSLIIFSPGHTILFVCYVFHFLFPKVLLNSSIRSLKKILVTICFSALLQCSSIYKCSSMIGPVYEFCLQLINK